VILPNRRLQNLLAGRTRGSVERKHQNISSVLIDLGYPSIDGYKPLANYQELLARVVQERLAKAGSAYTNLYPLKGQVGAIK
jgi:hypothetical protein